MYTHMYFSSIFLRLRLTTLFLLLSAFCFSQTFTEQKVFTTAGHFSWSAGAWGDYDNDGDLDILFSMSYLEAGSTEVYCNNGNSSFTLQTNSWFEGLVNGSIAWGDYDNDGDLDILLSGRSSTSKSYSPGSVVSTIFRNNGDNSFTQQSQISLAQVEGGSASWGDYDKDGHLDILLTGSGYSKVYRNNGNNSFTEQTSISLVGVQNSSVAWGDYNNDGYLDILLTGSGLSKIYKNNGDNSFSEQTNIVLTGISSGSATWGDYNNDGNLDILLTGSGISKIYRNNGDNSFTEQTQILLTGLKNSAAAWGDYDNDGDLDIIMTGTLTSLWRWEGVSKLFRNNGDNSFTEQTDCILTGVGGGSVAWGDYDNDGDLDLFLSGLGLCKIYRNNLTESKAIPENAPIGLKNTISGSSATLSWKPLVTDGVPQKSYSYNVKVVKGMDSVNLNFTHSDQYGLRRVAAMGNCQLDTFITFKNLKPGTYYWKVQAIDPSYQGGAYSMIDSFSIISSIQAHGLNENNLDGASARLNWVRGNGTKCVVFIKEGTGVLNLVDNMTYAASNNFGQGTSAGDGWYCVYNGIYENVDIAGLKGLTDYSVQVLEYYGNNGSEQYLRSTSIENALLFHTWNFTYQSGTRVQGYARNCSAWGDYNNDGYLDVLVAGSGYSKLFRNNGDNTFTEQTGIILKGDVSLTWGDYDNDGYLDILLCGASASKIYRNNGDNSFTDQTNIVLPGIFEGSVEWGDYDNDGYLDILMTGSISYYNFITKVFRNNGNNSFNEQTNISLDKVGYGTGVWGDYDNDGDLDILLTGNTGGGLISKIYRNNGKGSFSEQTHIFLIGVYNSSAAWGDYDNDGDLDIILSGAPNYGSEISKIYRNNGDNSFTEQTNIVLQGKLDGSASWGDYDNDGNLDILLTGSTNNRGMTIVYHNNGNNSFSYQTEIILSGMYDGSVNWGDYDNDGDLDILSNDQIYRNYLTKESLNTPNKKPLSPKNLTAQHVGNEVIFTWEGDTTDETPQQSLSYNIAFGKTQSSMTLGPPQSNGSFRTVPRLGNTSLNHFYKVKIDSVTLFWKVQAVDGGFQGGDWSLLDSFVVAPPLQAQNLIASKIDGSSAQLGWVRGNLERCVVFMKEGTGNLLPVDNRTYVASSAFGQGTTAGNGWYCVYNGSADHVTITSLNGLTNYSFKVFEYNGLAGFERYLTSLPSSSFSFNTYNFSLKSGVGLPTVSNGSTALGDYDNDGYLDVLLTGKIGSTSISKVYRNNGNSGFLEQTNIVLAGVEDGTATWGDYDKDGDLDILLTGNQGSSFTSKIYQNNGNNSFVVQTDIALANAKSGYWGDYNNDGYLDILLTGWGVTKIYRNDKNGGFAEQSDIILPSLAYASAAWGDYDNDGDLDLILTGSLTMNLSGPFMSTLYRNDGDNRLTEQTGASLTGVYNGSVSWSDYDNDGDLDLLLTGATTHTTTGSVGWGNGISRIYQNNGNGLFSEQTNITLTPLCVGNAAWGDYDNDGDLDILMSGYDNSIFYSKIYRNNSNNSFSVIPDYDITGDNHNSVAWADFDNDGDLDFLSDNQLYCNCTINNASQLPNKKPLSPKNLSIQKSGNVVRLSWEGDATDETPQKALSYNIAFGKTKWDMFLGSPNNFGTFRTIVSMGNAGLNTFFWAKVDTSDYYWVVQAVDGGYQGGEWSVVDSFSMRSTEYQKAEYIFYPNPVFNVLTINCSNMQESQVGIYSLRGGLIELATMNKTSITMDLSKLPQGMYLVKIVSAGGSTYKKIIKSNP